VATTEVVGDVEEAEDAVPAAAWRLLVAYCCSALMNSESRAVPADAGVAVLVEPSATDMPPTLLELEAELALDVELAEALVASWGGSPPW
jgi:hypothetical protein